MKISSKTGLVFVIIFLAGGLYLLGMFYYVAGDLGEFAQARRREGAVLGENVRRWRLPPSEVLLAFSAGQGNYGLDKLFITFATASRKRWLRVVRAPDNLLIYEKEAEAEFDSAVWRAVSQTFLIKSLKTGDSIELSPGGQTYNIVD